MENLRKKEELLQQKKQSIERKATRTAKGM